MVRATAEGAAYRRAMGAVGEADAAPAPEGERRGLALRNAVVLGLCIAAVDAGVICVLPLLRIRTPWVEVIADASIVAGLMVPALYALVLNPIRRHVADLRQREAALRESESRFRSVTQAASDAIISADSRGTIELWNTAAERMFGYSSAEALGQPLGLIIPERFRQAHQEGLRRVVATGESRLAGAVIEVSGRRKDGSEFPVELSVARWGSGEEIHFTGILRDITSRKQQERVLRHDEARFRSLARILQYRARDTQDFLDTALQEAIALTGSRIGYIYFYHEDRKQFVLNTWSKEVMQQCAVANPQNVYDLEKTGIWGEAVRQRRPIIVNDFAAPNLLKKGYPQGHVPVRRFMAVPVCSGDQIVAVAGVANKEQDYADADVQQLQLLMDAVWKVVEHRRAHEAVVQSEERFRTLVHAAPEPIFVQTRGCFAYLNPAAVCLFGAGDAGQLLGRPVAERIHPDYRARVSARIRQVNEGRQATSIWGCKYLRCDGSDVDVEASGTPFTFGGEDGALVFARDVTERRRAERELAAASGFYLSLLNQAPALIWRAGLDARCDWFNTTWLEFTGRTMEQECGEGWAQGVYPEDLHRCIAVYMDAFHARRPFEMEYRLRRHDGAYRWIVDHGMPFNSFRGEFAGYIGYCFDITERREAEEALGEASRAKDQFLARLSHELRTPLTPVVLAVSQWQASREFPAVLADDLAMVRRNLELEARLLEDLLDVNRILNGKLPLRLETVDLHQLITQALAILNADMRAKQLEVVLGLEAANAWIGGDAARVQQVFWNLLSNAAKFTPQGGRITIRSSNDSSGQIEVQVTDTGRGIEPELLPRLFQPFEQGGHLTTIQYGGLGLGLTICRAVVTLHGGTISARSQGLGQGSTMMVCFPTVAAVASPQPAPAATRPAGTNGRSHRILLVEDHPDTAKAMARLLRNYGHTVHTAHSVADALKLAGEPFDLLISDLGLPDGNGHDLMRQLSARHRHAFRAIAVSGFGMEEDQQRSREVGFAAHLTKPVSPAELRSAIADVFQHA